MNWLTAQRVPSPGDVTQDHCDRYLAERRLRRDAAGTAIGPLEASVARVAAARVSEHCGVTRLIGRWRGWRG